MSKDDKYKSMVDSFLAWKLPADFAPDAGISFTPPPELPDLYWPAGTNLLHAGQALEMFKHCVEIVDSADQRPTIDTMKSAFRTTEVEDGQFKMVFKFRTIEDMDRADDEWRAVAKTAVKEDA